MGNVIGDMRERISILQETSATRDESGANVPTITTRGPLWAKVEFKRVGSDERPFADQKTAFTSVHFTIRRNPNWSVSTKDQIEYRTKIYAIRSVLDADPRRSYLLIEAEQLGENQIT